MDGIRAHLARLTPRERQVFDLVVLGNTGKQIDRSLGTTERTIKVHRHRVMEKMQVQNGRTGISCRAGRGRERYPVVGRTPPCSVFQPSYCPIGQ